MDWDVIASYLPQYEKAAWLTLRLGVIGIAWAIGIGLVCAVLQYDKVPVLRRLVGAYIQLSRNTPLLVQLFFLYYGLPKVGIKTNAEICGIAGLAFLGGSYMAEAFRSGLEAIEPIQTESAYSLGMTRLQTLRYVILPQAVLDIPTVDTLNVHTSLLPRYRGAAPIQRAVMENWQPGDVTGVSIMRIVPALDAGPVYAQCEVPIGEHTAGSLHDALAEAGGELLLTVLDQLRDGSAQAREQDESRVTYAAKLAKEDGYIDWDRPAAEVHARIRGVTPWPGARLQARFDGQDELLPLLLQPGRVDEPCDGVQPGSLRTDKKGLCVACADRWYRLLVVRPQGRKDMEAAAFVNGHLRPAQHGVCGMAVPFGE